jgi:hypothetical protein
MPNPKEYGYLFDIDEAKGICFHCMLNLRFSDSVLLTSHVVEDGVPLVDHIRRNATRIDFTAIVTNAPIRDMPDFAMNQLKKGQNRSINLPNGGVANVFAYSQEGDELSDFAAKTDEILLDYMEKGKPLRFVSPKRVLDDVIITSKDTPSDSSTGDAIQFQIGLTEVRFASTTSVTIKRSGKLPQVEVKQDPSKGSIAFNLFGRWG